jgi:anti-sigma factor RsiW
VRRIRPFARAGDHDWSQGHLSHYVEGDLTARSRRRLERHAAECPDCSRGIRAMKALLGLIARIDTPGDIPAPASPFDRVRADTTSTPESARGPEQ